MQTVSTFSQNNVLCYDGHILQSWLNSSHIKRKITTDPFKIFLLINDEGKEEYVQMKVNSQKQIKLHIGKRLITELLWNYSRSQRHTFGTIILPSPYVIKKRKIQICRTAWNPSNLYEKEHLEHSGRTYLSFFLKLQYCSITTKYSQCFSSSQQ